MSFDAFPDLFRVACGRDPFPYQTRLALANPLPPLLEAPTGSGKTLAILLTWLWRRRSHPDPSLRARTPRRLIYCLPMRVLVEQTARVARTCLRNLGLLDGEDRVRLVVLMGGEDGGDWDVEPERDAVLVGTQDMLLSRALNRGYAMSRFRWPTHFGLLNADSLWAIDEVQLMGNGLATTSQLDSFRRQFGVAAPAPTIWMSATIDASWLRTINAALPADPTVHRLDDADFADPRLAKRLNAAKTVQRLAVRARDKSYDAADVASWVMSHHAPESLTLVVVNTVKRAQDMFAQIERGVKRSRQPPDLLLLHSRFRPPDRRDLVERLTSDPPSGGRVCVATQVVEAGLDISARTLVTELAPWASLVQRLGRCNRFGEQPDARVFWIDLDSAKNAAPYLPEELDLSRARLRELEGMSVAPSALPRATSGPEATHVLRRRDLIDLFDTTPDLSGNDVDVGRFVRGTDELDVRVFWRRWPRDEVAPPPPDLAAPSREELCAVPVSEVRAFLAAHPHGRAYTWDHVEREWRYLDLATLHPGLVLLLPALAGGYHPSLGWVGTSAKETEPIGPREDLPPEGTDDDRRSQGAWQSLSDHSEAVVEALDQIVAEVGARGLTEQEQEALRVAARWHDRGKAHAVFQETLLQAEPDAAQRRERAKTLWAKSPGRSARHARPHFRHELASALAVLQADLDPALADLVAYLVAAHHGKIRLAIRSFPDERPPSPGRRIALGVADGDVLPPTDLGGTSAPPVTLDLGVSELGGTQEGSSWIERAIGLRDRLGPFRLAYLEALLICADVRASRAASRRGGV